MSLIVEFRKTFYVHAHKGRVHVMRIKLFEFTHTLTIYMHTCTSRTSIPSSTAYTFENIRGKWCTSTPLQSDLTLKRQNNDHKFYLRFLLGPMALLGLVGAAAVAATVGACLTSDTLFSPDWRVLLNAILADTTRAVSTDSATCTCGHWYGKLSFAGMRGVTRGTAVDVATEAAAWAALTSLTRVAKSVASNGMTQVALEAAGLVEICALRGSKDMLSDRVVIQRE
jgi:hypothetical protein